MDHVPWLRGRGEWEWRSGARGVKGAPDVEVLKSCFPVFMLKSLLGGALLGSRQKGEEWSYAARLWIRCARFSLPLPKTKCQSVACVSR